MLQIRIILNGMAVGCAGFALYDLLHAADVRMVAAQLCLALICLGLQVCPLSNK